MIDKNEKESLNKKIEVLKENSRSKLMNDETNPCIQEHRLTFKCLNENNYDQDKCKLYFDNYNNCKNFWLQIQRQRRNKGISPELPPVEERQKIKEKFIKY